MIKQRADHEGPDGEGSAGAGSSGVRPALANLRKLADHGPLTLLTATKRSDISEAAVLADLLAKR